MAYPLVSPVTGEVLLTKCGHPYLDYDHDRVTGLLARLRAMVEEHGMPSLIRWSPDIDHQTVGDGEHIGTIGLNSVKTRCDPSLPPNAIVFGEEPA